ncbi:MAG TPA: phenylalanine--tRNA ligase subunit beta, partial [Bryobacteraceae bacterium]|nr:phenylalanine--tRNA ligase subunit beta [Bryobacteraceae bacterium]
SYNWLRELVDGLDAAPAELMGLITIKTAECDGVHAVAPHLSSVVAAQILEVSPIEGSRNVRAVVDAGTLGRRTVVCGAPNCRMGMVTAYVPAGTVLGGREIRKAVVAGVESDGMLASGAELGLNRDKDGILQLSLRPGDTLGLHPDWVIEVDNKSLTHRPDLWGHHGMAREVAAITGKPLREAADLSLLPSGAAPIEVRIDDFELCPRYSALMFENVTVQPSPLWLQYRLESVGLNPINNIVDVTNWVMAELGQPTHAFDAEKLRGGIVVRRAAEGERIAALNGETYGLRALDLVIADDEGAVALAGVIGGNDSAIDVGTTRIVLESANFHAGTVRRTSASLKLRTDASMRFEKAQDPVNTVRALARAIALLQEVSPGIRLVGGVADVLVPPKSPTAIALSLDWLNRKIGREVDPAEVRAILTALSFEVEETSAGTLSVTVPSWRATKDVAIREDLVEEIGRMIGYASIPPQAPRLPASVPPANAVREFHHKVRTLVTAQGFHEVYNYSFLSEEDIARFGLNPQDHVRVLNPIAAGQTHLRTTLLPGIWRNVTDNLRYLDEFRLFEIGVEIHRMRDHELPHEVHHLAAAVYGKLADAEPLFELKRLALCIAPGIVLDPETPPERWEHPARTANLLLGNVPVGRLTEFHPDFIERGRAAVLDLDLDRVMKLAREESHYTALRRFPTSAFDLSVVVPERAYAGVLERELRTFGGTDVEALEFVRQYSGPPLEPGTKSVSYRLTAGAPDRTLSSDELTAIRQRIIDGMRSRGYELRV